MLDLSNLNLLEDSDVKSSGGGGGDREELPMMEMFFETRRFDRENGVLTAENGDFRRRSWRKRRTGKLEACVDSTASAMMRTTRCFHNLKGKKQKVADGEDHQE